MHTNQSTALVGSIADIAKQKGQTEADAMLEAQVVVFIDTSLSMGTPDAGPSHKETRYDVACDELAVLQSQRPGEIIVGSFSNYAVWCSDGVPTNQCGGTDILGAIEAFNEAGFDGLLPLTLMCDGEVGDAQEKEAKRIVRDMKSKVNTIFIGDAKSEDGARGAKFLKDLARVGRGQHAVTIEPGMLAKPTLLMLGAPNAPIGPAIINL